MTEKLFTGTLNHNQDKTKLHSDMYSEDEYEVDALGVNVKGTATYIIPYLC